MKLETGMLLYDPGEGTPSRAQIRTVKSPGVVISHHGSVVEESTLTERGVLPPEWKVIDGSKLADVLNDDADLLEFLSR